MNRSLTSKSRGHSFILAWLQIQAGARNNHMHSGGKKKKKGKRKKGSQTVEKLNWKIQELLLMFNFQPGIPGSQTV